MKDVATSSLLHLEMRKSHNLLSFQLSRELLRLYTRLGFVAPHVLSTVGLRVPWHTYVLLLCIFGLGTGILTAGIFPFLIRHKLICSCKYIMQLLVESMNACFVFLLNF